MSASCSPHRRRLLCDGGIDIVRSDTGDAGGSERGDHVNHHRVVLHADLQPFQIGNGMRWLVEIEGTATGIVVAQPHQAGTGSLDVRQHLLPDRSVKHSPFMSGVLVQVRELNGIERRNVRGDRRRGDTSERQISGLHGFDGAGFLSVQRAACIHFNLHAAVGLLFDQTRELVIGERGGISFGMNFRKLQRDGFAGAAAFCVDSVDPCAATDSVNTVMTMSSEMSTFS